MYKVALIRPVDASVMVSWQDRHSRMKRHMSETNLGDIVSGICPKINKDRQVTSRAAPDYVRL